METRKVVNIFDLTLKKLEHSHLVDNNDNKYFSQLEL